MKAAKILILIMMVCFPLSIYSQSPDDVEVIKRIADNIRENTTFKIENVKTKELYASTDNLPVKAEYRIHSRYNTWKYWNGVLTVAMIRLGNTLNDKTYTDYGIRNIGFIFDQLPYFEKQYKKDLIEGDMNQHFRLDRLDDCGAMGAGIADVYSIDPDERFMNYLKKASDYIMTKQDRLPDGTYARTWPNVLTVWSDDLYMSIPLLARMGKLTGDNKFFDESARQVLLFDKHLYSPVTALNYHCWYNDLQVNGVAHWGRGLAWGLMAEAELLSFMPDDHPMRDTLISVLTRQIVSIARYQSETGLWHQLINKPDSYLETSCTAMLTYTIAMAVNEGWIDKRYESVAQKGWEGIKSRVHVDGQVEGICQGTSVSNNLVDYYKRPTPLNDIHGLGPVILAGCEIIRLNNK